MLKGRDREREEVGRLSGQEAIICRGQSSVSGAGGAGKEVEREAVLTALSGNASGRGRKSRSRRSLEAWKRCLSS